MTSAISELYERERERDTTVYRLSYNLFFVRREQFLQWIESLPLNQSPSWLGLPNNAEVVLLSTKGLSMTAKLLKMQSLSDDEDFISTVGSNIT